MDTNQTTETYHDRPRGLPTMLNVLTILTFIGCGLAYLGALMGFFTSGMNREVDEEQLDKANNMFGGFFSVSPELMEKTYDYRYIILLAGLFFVTLCLIGAIQMRKLKKSGYPLYVVGELGQPALGVILLGSVMTTSAMITSFVIPIIFVLLYTTQRKYLVN